MEVERNKQPLDHKAAAVQAIPLQHNTDYTHVDLMNLFSSVLSKDCLCNRSALDMMR